jgi:hypothetical protein
VIWIVCEEREEERPTRPETKISMIAVPLHARVRAGRHNVMPPLWRQQVDSSRRRGLPRRVLLRPLEVLRNVRNRRGGLDEVERVD